MTNERVYEIDLLRFFAALAVVFFHYSFRGYAADSMTVMPYPLLAGISKYGYLGVELFFMISGFVILMTASAGSLRTFVLSRIVRLYPAFWACCTITFLATLIMGGARYSATFGQYLANMTMLNGFFGVPSIDGAYWSLFVELRFYGLVSLLLLFGAMSWIEAIMMIWLVASVIVSIYPNEIFRVLLITDYSAFFIAGAAFYLVWFRGLSSVRLLAIVGAWCLAIRESLGRLAEFEVHYGTATSKLVVILLISLFFLAMLLISLRVTGRLSEINWVPLGALTYPLYLIHQNVGFMIFNKAYPAVSAHLLFWGMVALDVLLAYGVNVLVERRFSYRIKRALNGAIDRMVCWMG